MMKIRSGNFVRWRAAMAAAMVASLGATMGATTLARMSVAQMSRAAQVIVRAQCEENSTGWDAGEIWTFTTFRVEEVWRGEAPAQISVRLLGGRAGNLTSSVAGIPRFRPGEEVVLFLERTPRGDFSIVSWEQGTFRIRRDIRTGGESATQDTASLATFDPATRRFEAGGIVRMPVDFLHAQVDAAISSQSGRKP
ncbi:MAG: hypothetical protein ACLQMT_05790 [Candidatus Acidiferrales bacterium]